MPIIGRQGGRRTVHTGVSNKGMAGRANERLNSAAENSAVKFEEALAVDGVPVYIWNKHMGQHPCACRRVPGSYYAQEMYGESGRSTTSNVKKPKSKVRQDKLNLADDTPEDFFGTGKKNTRLKDKILQTHNIEDIEVDAVADNDLAASGSFADTDDLLNSVSVNCPICYDSGYVDSWSLHGGQRYLFDFSGMYYVDIVGGNFEERGDKSIPSMSLASDSTESVTWSVDFMLVWKKLHRISVYNGIEVLSRNSYKLHIQLPDTTEWIELRSPRDFDAFRSGSVLNGESLVRLTPTADEDLVFTHVDMIFSYQAPARAQLPDIEVAYEEEYADWNLNIQVELSAKAVLKEGSYLVDSKYNKVWKVDSFNKRVTSKGVIFGYTLNCRALQPFEKLYGIFNVNKS